MAELARATLAAELALVALTAARKELESDRELNRTGPFDRPYRARVVATRALEAKVSRLTRAADEAADALELARNDGWLL